MGSEFLAPFQHRIEQALTTSLSQPTASHYLTEAMSYATLNGGKRLRAGWDESVLDGIYAGFQGT